MTYRTIGGIIDLFIITGPTPADVIRQYWTLIGNPLLTPYWSLGFHLCKWDYGTIANLTAVINSMKAADFPWDVQWTDIEALYEKRIFTYNNETWAGLPELVEQLHAENKKYISINDPGISVDMSKGNYSTYWTGIEDDIYIKWANGSGHIIGSVWPGLTAFPDWFHPKIFEWWFRELSTWNKTLPVDGLWIDMNEVTSFTYGSIDGCHEYLDNPYYVPKIFKDYLWAKTICTSAMHYGGQREFDLHSLYGLGMAMATNYALTKMTPERPFILTRSSFPGSGNYTAKWGGDNFATYDDLYYSITDILNFNIFGFSLTGDDLCGFIYDTTAELCTRWFELGAFNTFMRNHNNNNSRAHHPSAFNPDITKIMKGTVIRRYRMLPYFYTLMFESHIRLQTVVQPMFFQWWKDPNTHPIDTQLLLGDAMLIVLVTQEGHREVYGYFPDSNNYWYTIRLAKQSQCFS
ncbi:hypothetical protein ACOME3_003351 [Neoechinorhynchus agilis]